MRNMERYRTMRAYSAGGVVFRLVPRSLTNDGHVIDRQPPTVNRALISPPASSPAPGQGTRFGEEVTSPPDRVATEHPRDVTIEVALVGRSHPGIWALPKGTPQPGETIEQVAVREVQEETGLQVRLIAYIGSITYSFVRHQVRYHKQVRHFLLEAIGGDTSLHDQEYDMVEWFPLYEACRRLTYQNEVNILYQAEDILQRWLRSREGHT
jgi:8-oxo-dGTP pyrophosphatase MutT (NUDIX family)